MNKSNPDLLKARSYFPDKIYREILQMENSSHLKELISAIEDFVEKEGRGITTSQLRNIYAKVKKETNYNKAQLIRPVLAYTAARQGTQGARIVIALLDDLLSQVSSADELSNFQTFMESIVGYHKFHHSK